VRHTISVKKGFRYDGASIPRIGWSIIGAHPGGVMHGSALPHDALYLTRGGKRSVCKVTITGTYSRRESDELLKILSIKHGIRRHRAKIMYFVLRMCGLPFWGRKNKLNT